MVEDDLGRVASVAPRLIDEHDQQRHEEQDGQPGDARQDEDCRGQPRSGSSPRSGRPSAARSRSLVVAARVNRHEASASA